jgi:hypothetical protein
MTGDALHASVLEAHLLVEEVELLAKAVDLRGVPVTGIATPRGPGMGTGQGELGEGDGVEDGEANAPGPVPGKTKLGFGCPARHENLRKELSDERYRASR